MTGVWHVRDAKIRYIRSAQRVKGLARMLTGRARRRPRPASMPARPVPVRARARFADFGYRGCCHSANLVASDTLCAISMLQPFSAPRLTHRLLATSDAGEQASTGSFSEWGQDYQQLSNGRYQGMVEDLALAPLKVLRETGNRIVFEAGALVPGAFALGVAAGMRGDAYFCGREYGGDALAVLQPGAEFEMRTADSFEIVAAVFDPGALCALLQTPAGCEAQAEAQHLAAALRGLPTVSRNPVAQDLVRLLRALLDTARHAPAALETWPAQVQIADEFLALVAACTAPPTHAATRAIGQGRDRVVRRLRLYLARQHDGGANAVTVAGVCTELGVTRRTLQNCMQEVLGIAPHAYLKAVRLHGARRGLKESAHQSIADVAARWGFWHPSQFALDYCRLFGERPSETRARGAVFSDS
jgi:AraC family transcriptional regulator, ethanolamine operon transcriptional activator